MAVDKVTDTEIITKLSYFFGPPCIVYTLANVYCRNFTPSRIGMARPPYLLNSKSPSWIELELRSHYTAASKVVKLSFIYR